MCYQSFMTFSCGCGTLNVDDPCEYATHPFSIRYLCPNYTSDSERSIHACGPGDWWCAGSKDADYISDLFRLCRAASAKCEQLSKQQQQLKQYLQSLKVDAQQKGVSDHRFKNRSVISRLNLLYTTNAEQCNAFAQRGKAVATLIDRVKQFYSSHGGPHSQHPAFSKAPSFLDAVGPGVTKSVTSVLLSTDRSVTPTQFSVSDKTTVKERVSSLLAQQAAKHEEQILQHRGRPHQVAKQATPVKRKRKSLSPAKAKVNEEKPAIRRSTRFSNKKVNYEESDGSSPTRTVSPGESDVSGFDPSNRSDISGSPDQSPPKRKRSKPALQSQVSSGGDAKIGAVASSFSSKINEYRERLGRLPSPMNAEARPQSTLISRQTENARRRDHALLRPPRPYEIPQVTQAFPNVSIYHSRPPTRHGPPNDRRNNSSISNFTQAPATPNFLSNQHTPQLMSHQSSPPTSSEPGIRGNMRGVEDMNQVRRNSLTNVPSRNSFFSQGGLLSSTVYEQTLPAQPNNATEENNFSSAHVQIRKAPAESPYARLRRSFSATADFTPPATTTITPPTTDPKKRKQPVSSPLQSTNKRPRLSFPDDDFPNNAPTLLNHASPRSSPSRMGAEATTDPYQGALYEEPTNQFSTPAPNLAPTAVMYQPSLRPNQTTVSTVPNGGQDGQVGDVEDGYDDDFFDALIEEDKFSTELPDFIFN